MWIISRVFLWLLIELLLMKNLHSSVKFTNIKCQVIDRDLCAFTKCDLKAFNRTTNLLSIRMPLYQEINNMTINMDVRKRANGYKPFLYNVTFDACRFFRERTKNTLMKFVHDMVLPYTNVNHTCPLDNEFIVDNWPSQYLDSSLINVLPMPKGEYAAFTSISINTKPLAKFKLFLTIN